MFGNQKDDHFAVTAWKCSGEKGHYYHEERKAQALDHQLRPLVG